MNTEQKIWSLVFFLVCEYGIGCSQETLVQCKIQSDCDPGWICLDQRCQKENSSEVASEPDGGLDAGLEEGSALVDEFQITESLAELESLPSEPENQSAENENGTLNQGDLSGNQAKVGAPGAACIKDTNCTNANDQDAICLLESDGFPGGYCTFLCSLPESGNYGCNEFRGVYIPYSNTWGDGYCYHPCEAPNDCRINYRCVDNACRPNCADQNFPCQYGVCDPTKKVCVAE